MLTDSVGFVILFSGFAFQLARYERGTETLSPEKYASCMEKDKRRGEIASSLKQRRAEAAGRLEELRVKYGPMLELFTHSIKTSPSEQ